ncbi:hypothetical protein ACFYT3_16550 [Nocardia amikacinitolerans]|uniref:hypothetical protein n=1 Tax=Nocardia amikacinitolerans TaxID=756689 RepID=UPI0036CCB68A
MVKDTNRRSSQQTRRKHVCDRGHVFYTLEEPEGWKLEQDVHVRRSGDKRVQTTAFRPDRLQAELRAGVIGRMTENQIVEVVDAVVARLRHEIVPAKAKEITGDEWSRLVEITGCRRRLAALWDHEVREAVEYELWRRETYRTAHVLFAMAFIGRADCPGRQGWTCAEDVLEWMFGDTAYPDLREPIPYRTPASTCRWHPTTAPTFPVQVRKRDGAVVEYVHRRFLQSIQYALLGRPHAERVSHWVSWWVLRDLEGQRRVHSSQLSVGVLDCLRRLDDIAYLRWATQLKNFRAVREIKVEALGLITHPSDKILIDPDAEVLPRKLLSIDDPSESPRR